MGRIVGLDNSAVCSDNFGILPHGRVLSKLPTWLVSLPPGGQTVLGSHTLLV